VGSIRRFCVGAAIVLIVAGCASTGTPNKDDTLSGLRDPYEHTNRAIFRVNMAVDRAVGRPLTKVYRIIPQYGRNRIRDFIANYSSPVTFINDMLQGETHRAEVTFVRFWVNTLMGIGGLWDVAGKNGLPGHKEDFGQTLAVWGVGPGPYLMVPLLGPHTTRHLAGRAVDSWLNPFSYLLGNAGLGWVEIIGSAVDALDTRERTEKALEDLKRTSLDYYAAIRSLYWQHRLSEIRNGRVEKLPVPGDAE
jgi:phospholipid-binding lipoprotein MlaA